MADLQTGLAKFLQAFVGAATGTLGSPVLVGFGRSEGNTAANANVVTITVPSSDCSYEVSCNLLATVATSFTFVVELAYTDEGSTARTVNFPFTLGGPTVTTTCTNGAGALYLGIPLHVRAKAGTTMVGRTQAAGAYATVTYNIEILFKRTV